MIPRQLVAGGPQEGWHPDTLIEAHSSMTAAAKRNWVWWNISKPRCADHWFHRPDRRRPDRGGMAPAFTDKILAGPHVAGKSQESGRCDESGHRTVGGVYRRTRPDENGINRQRAEVRFDDIAGCLRTPAGGSSRQTILVVEGKTVRSRLLSPREAARLMGLSDDYILPTRYNDAYHVCGDGVCAPVVRHIAACILEPMLNANRASELVAAE